MKPEEVIENLSPSKIEHLATQKSMVILPRNWAASVSPDSYVYFETTLTISKLLKSNGINSEILGYTQEAKTLNNRHSEWIAPILFLSSAYLLQNPDAISVALGIISNYLTEIFMGKSREPTANIELIIETPRGTVKRASYKGPVSGLEHFKKSLKELK